MSNYETGNEIVVKTQEALDKISKSYSGTIYLDNNGLIVSKKYKGKVIVRSNYSVIARKKTHVIAKQNSHVEASNKAKITLYDKASVEAWDNCFIEANDNAFVGCLGNVTVIARGNSNIYSYGHSNVVALHDANVYAHGNSTVEAWGNTKVEAHEWAHVIANDFVQVYAMTVSGNEIELHGNARVIYTPNGIKEYLANKNIHILNNKGIFYKCVHKKNGKYFSNADPNFEYVIGKAKRPPIIHESSQKKEGIFVSDLKHALDYGQSWNDLAILEVEVDIYKTSFSNPLCLEKSEKIICDEVYVLREIPLKECGLYGEILAKRK